jgi:hypothetical protein
MMRSNIFHRLALLAALAGFALSIPMSNVTITEGNFTATSLNITATTRNITAAGHKTIATGDNVTAIGRNAMTVRGGFVPPTDEPSMLDWFEFIRNLFTPCEYPPDPDEVAAKNINLTGLTPKCAETIWCRYRLLKRQRDWSNSTHTAVLWPDIRRDKAEKLFDSPTLNGTLFNESEEFMWGDGGGWIHTYAGQWDFEQVCFLLKRKEVRQSP